MVLFLAVDGYGLIVVQETKFVSCIGFGCWWCGIWCRFECRMQQLHPAIERRQEQVACS